MVYIFIYLKDNRSLLDNEICRWIVLINDIILGLLFLFSNIHFLISIFEQYAGGDLKEMERKNYYCLIFSYFISPDNVFSESRITFYAAT